MNFISSDEKSTKLRYIVEKRGEDPRGYPSNLLNANYFPTKHISIPVNKDVVLQNGLVKAKDADKIVDKSIHRN